MDRLRTQLTSLQSQLKVETERAKDGEEEVQRLRAQLQAMAAKRLDETSERVMGNDRHMRTLQLHVEREVVAEAKERRLRAQLLQAGQRCTELESRSAQLQAALSAGESRFSAELHDCALQLAEYRALVQRLTEEVEAGQEGRTATQRNRGETEAEEAEERTERAASAAELGVESGGRGHDGGL